MPTQRFQIEIDRKYQSDHDIVVNIDEIPFATALFISSTRDVILNKRAYDILEMKVNEVFDLTAWQRINPYFEDILKKFE